MPQAGIQYFDDETKAWKSTTIPRIEATHCYCTESVGSKLIVAANDAIGCCIYRYDTEADVWERHPHSCGIISDLCVTEDYMYAFRADLFQVPRRYNLAKRQWQTFAEVGITSNNSNSYISCGAAVLHSEVYVLHGNYCESASNYNLSMKPAVLHCFDPQKNKWEVKATTSHCHFGSSLFVVNSKLYVAGGKVKIAYNYCPSGNPAPVEVYNEENNTWSVVEQKHIPPNNLGAVEIEGRVYFIINRFPIDSGIRIAHGELRSVQLNEWGNLAQIDKNAALGYMVVKRA